MTWEEKLEAIEAWADGNIGRGCYCALEGMGGCDYCKLNGKDLYEILDAPVGDEQDSEERKFKHTAYGLRPDGTIGEWDPESWSVERPGGGEHPED
jgi:hypothetical protein